MYVYVFAKLNLQVCTVGTAHDCKTLFERSRYITSSRELVFVSHESDQVQFSQHVHGGRVRSVGVRTRAQCHEGVTTLFTNERDRVICCFK